jgi:hypothetical protein
MSYLDVCNLGVFSAHARIMKAGDAIPVFRRRDCRVN